MSRYTLLTELTWRYNDHIDSRQRDATYGA